MIVCKDCGNKNQNGTTFCEACGTFLEWGGESVLTGAHPAIPSPDAPAEPATPLAPAPAEAAPTPPPACRGSGPMPGGAAFKAQRLPVISDPQDDAAPGATPLAPRPASACRSAPAAQEPKAPGPSRPARRCCARCA